MGSHLERNLVHSNKARYKPGSQLSTGMPACTSQARSRPKNPDQPLTKSRCKQETAVSCVSRLWGGLLPGESHLKPGQASVERAQHMCSFEILSVVLKRRAKPHRADSCVCFHHCDTLGVQHSARLWPVGPSDPTVSVMTFVQCFLCTQH